MSNDKTDFDDQGIESNENPPKSKWEKFTKKQKNKEDTSTESTLPETEEGEGVSVEAPTTESVDAEFAELMNEVEACREKAMRAQAELENVRRRSEREVSNARKFANERLLNDMLPVVDSMVRGLEGGEPADPSAKAIYDGVKITLEMLEKTLSQYGVVTISPEQGEAFDPQRHEAMSMQQDPNLPSDTIIQVLQKGYELNGRVIRAAMVVVNKI